MIVAALAEHNDKSNERSARHKIIGMVSNDGTPEESLFIENPRVSDRLQKTLLPRTPQSQECLVLGLGGEVVSGAHAQLDWREDCDHSHDPFTCFATSMDLAMVGLARPCRVHPSARIGGWTRQGLSYARVRVTRQMDLAGAANANSAQTLCAGATPCSPVNRP